MSERYRVTRKEFLDTSFVTIGALLLAACTPDSTPTLEPTTQSSPTPDHPATGRALDTTADALKQEREVLASQQAKDATDEALTQEAGQTPTSVKTHTPEHTPTPSLSEIDLINERKLEFSQPGENITLEKPRFTTAWVFPWEAEEGEPKRAYINLVWGEEKPAGIVTSSKDIFFWLRDQGGLVEKEYDFGFLEIYRVDGTIRPESVETQVSNAPAPETTVVDAKYMTTKDAGGNDLREKVEEVKLSERLAEFLGSVNWEELPEEFGGVSGKEVGDFVFSFTRGLLNAAKEAGIDIALFD